MSQLDVDTVQAKTTNGDLTLQGNGTGVPNLESGFKVNGTVGVPVSALQTGTDGELITWDASGNPTTVAAGTATQLLTSNGAGAAPTFQDAPAGGASTLLATNTFSTDATSVFTGLNSDYDVYMVEGFIRSDLAASNQDTLRLEVSTDGGSTYESTNYQGSVQGADYYVSNLASSTATSYFEFGNSGSNAGSFHQAHFRCWIIDPSSASDRLIVHLQMGGMFRPNLGEGMVTHFGGVWDDTTSAVDAIRFSLRVGNFGSGKMRLYGVK